MFTFWPLFIAFVLSMSGHLIAEQFEKWKIQSTYIFIISILAGVYLFIGGIYMAVGWHDPIGAADTFKYIHRPRDWVVIQLLRVWPYFLAVVGLLAVYIGVVSLKKRKIF